MRNDIIYELTGDGLHGAIDLTVRTWQEIEEHPLQPTFAKRMQEAALSDRMGSFLAGLMHDIFKAPRTAHEADIETKIEAIELICRHAPALIAEDEAYNSLAGLWHSYLLTACRPSMRKAYDTIAALQQPTGSMH